MKSTNDSEAKGTVWFAKTPTGSPRRWPSGRVRYRGKVTWPDGKRQDFAVPEINCATEQIAADFVAERQAEITAGGMALIPAPKKTGPEVETCDVWYERFKTFREKEIGRSDLDAGRWAKWISKSPVRKGTIVFGELPIRDVTPDDIEDVKEVLTAAVLAYEAAGNVSGDGRLAPKSAQNTWAALTTPMKYASTRKGPRELRVREDKGNPCLGIPPPRDGASKRAGTGCARISGRPFLEWLTPRDRAWAEAYAIGLYLHLRPGELHELRVRDLVLVDREVRISRAWDERERAVKAPKTNEGIRTVSVPDALMPLLERIARERNANDRVCPIVAATRETKRGRGDNDTSHAGLFRNFLRDAGVNEPSFFVESATHLRIDFRSLRDTGITWRFLDGERAEVVQREAGHEHIATTLGYAKEVHDKRGRYGAPFPALPAALSAPTPAGIPGVVSTPTVYAKRRARKTGPSWVGAEGFETEQRADLAATREDVPQTERARVDLSAGKSSVDGPSIADAMRALEAGDVVRAREILAGLESPRSRR